MRALLITLLFSTLVFAYKDAFFMGVYQSIQDGEGTSDDYDHTIESRENQNGFRLGWDKNSDETQLAKTRYELAYEKRALEYSLGGAKTEADGWRLSGSIGWGYNVDWLLTHEIVPFVRLGAGMGRFDDIGRGTDMTLGIGMVYTTRRFEILAGVDREFWQLSGTKFPFRNFVENDLVIHNFHAGVNIRF